MSTSAIIDYDLISEDERERVLCRAESNAAFRLAGRALSDLADQTGEPESEIELVIGQNRDLLVLFRLYRHAALVNRRLAGFPEIERLTAQEWEAKRLIEQQKFDARQQMASSQGMANSRNRQWADAIGLGSIFPK